MMVDGYPRATLTGNDIDGMKDRLFKTYFHLPTLHVKGKRKAHKSKRKKRR